MIQSARRCVVSGRVQGVFYRASTQQRAQKLGLTGWVRNRPDGGVEVFACGEAEQLEALCRWLQQGPEMAKVSSVECQDCAVEAFTDFSIRP